MTQIRTLVAGQHRELASLTRDQRTRAARITREALARVQQVLATVDPTSWAAGQGRAVSSQLQGLLAELVRDQGTALATGTTRAAASGARSATRILQALDATLGTPGPLRVDVLSWVAANAQAVSGLRVRTQAASLARYGAAAADEIGAEVARVALAGGTWVDARPAIESATARVVQGRQWMVDRIARTEVAAAYNGARVQVLLDEDRAEQATGRTRDRLQKKLVAVFDAKTGQDSVLLHGQTVPVGDPFIDVSGREYMAPPNRPHDREIVIPWRDSYGSSAAYTRTTAVGDNGRSAAGLRRRLLTEAQRDTGTELARVRRDIRSADDQGTRVVLEGRLAVLVRKQAMIQAQLAQV